MGYNKFPWTNMHGFNLDWVIETVQYCKSKVDEFGEIVANFPNIYETKKNITDKRKLSEQGDFTGTWFGDSKSNVDLKLAEGLNNYNTLINYLYANPQIAWTIWDGKFFTTVEESGEILDGGLFTDFDTQEVDCGLFIYNCNCLI